MKLNPTTKELFTEDGQLIKVLHCPLRIRWEQLQVQTGSAHRNCMNCEHQVLHTAAMSDANVLAAVQTDPTTCLYISADQENLTVLPRGALGS